MEHPIGVPYFCSVVYPIFAVWCTLFFKGIKFPLFYGAPYFCFFMEHPIWGCLHFWVTPICN